MWHAHQMLDSRQCVKAKRWATSPRHLPLLEWDFFLLTNTITIIRPITNTIAVMPIHIPILVFCPGSGSDVSENQKID